MKMFNFRNKLTNLYCFRNSDARSIETKQKQYIKENINSFKQLISQAKQRGTDNSILIMDV